MTDQLLLMAFNDTPLLPFSLRLRLREEIFITFDDLRLEPVFSTSSCAFIETYFGLSLAGINASTECVS